MKLGVILHLGRKLVLSFAGVGDFVGGCLVVGYSAVGYSGLQNFWVVYFGGEDFEVEYFAVGDFVMGDFEVGNLVMKQVFPGGVLEVSACPVVYSETA